MRPGSPTKPVPGFDIQILDEDGREKAADDIGSLVIKLPLPPGGLTTLWNNDAGFVETYLERYPGYYLSGDAGYFDADGYGWVMARIDDIINVAGHRLSPGRWKKSSLRTRPWPRRRWSAWSMRSRARCRWGWWC